jgi:hypothetical protein
MGAPLDLYQVTLTRDELLLLGAIAGLGGDVLSVGLEVLKPGGDPRAGGKAVARFLAEVAAVPDRIGTIQRLAAKLDPLIAAAKEAR